MLNFYDFIQVYVFTTNHHLKITLFSERGRRHLLEQGRLLGLIRYVIQSVH